MQISDLIKELETIKEEQGDIMCVLLHEPRTSGNIYSPQIDVTTASLQKDEYYELYRNNQDCYASEGYDDTDYKGVILC